MLNFKTINALALVLLLLFLMAHFLWSVLLIYSLIILFFYSCFLIYGSIKIQTNFYYHSITQINDKNSVVLSFDDGPHELHTPKLLDVLNKHQVKAIFCVIGKNAEMHPQIIKRIHKEGHFLVSHSYSHSVYFPLFSAKKIEEEISRTAAIIQDITGESPRFFRSPFGVTNPTIGKALKNTQLKSLAWSLRSFDTKQKANTLKKVIKQVKGGDIILFHDHLAQTPQLIDALIPLIEKKNLLLKNRQVAELLDL